MYLIKLSVLTGQVVYVEIQLDTACTAASQSRSRQRSATWQLFPGVGVNYK